MDPILFSLLPLLVPLAFLFFHALRRPLCPDCGAPLPLFYSPFAKTRRMWRAGGYLCARCGCETDAAGQKVTAETSPAAFPTAQWVVLAVLLLVGAGLAGAGVLLHGRGTAPPPVIAPPQQAPPVAPVNERLVQEQPERAR